MRVVRLSRVSRGYVEVISGCPDGQDTGSSGLQ